MRYPSFFSDNEEKLWTATESLTQNMRIRGGGILGMELRDKSDLEPSYFQLEVKFDTCDSMGANFINSCLETIAKEWKLLGQSSNLGGEINIIMSILSNFTPECVVRAEVECAIDEIKRR